jgi:hypothetical protein
MKKEIKVGKPQSYSFVRGTSVEKVIELFTKSEQETENPQYLDETIFHVYARPNFPKTYEFSSNFRAKSERDNILPAKYFAQMHAGSDYLENVFSGIYSNTQCPRGDFNNLNFKTFYNDFSQDLESIGFTAQKVEDEFIRARRYRGVLLYFNDLLLQNEMFQDKNEKQNRRFNSVQLHSENPIKLECLTAIEPLGNYDKIEWKYIMKKLI